MDDEKMNNEVITDKETTTDGAMEVASGTAGGGPLSSMGAHPPSLCIPTIHATQSATTTSISDAANHLQLLFQIANLQATQLSDANNGGGGGMSAVSDPLGIFNRGYKRKHSSIDSAVSSTMMTPVEVGTPVDESGSPCFWPGSGATCGTPMGMMTGLMTPGAVANRRNKTFSPEMSDLFVHEVIRRKETLVENNTNREVDFNRQKKHAWQEVYEAVRSVFPSFTCTVEGMKTHWRYRKRRVRDAAPYMKRFREQGVGAEAIGERMNDADWAIYDILNGVYGSSCRASVDKHDGDSDLEEKDNSATPPAKFAKLEDLKGEDSCGAYPGSPASIVVSGEESNTGPPLATLAASLLLRNHMPPTSAMSTSGPTHTSPIVVPALRPLNITGRMDDAEDERRLRIELLNRQMTFYASMNNLVADVRTMLPGLVNRFFNSTTPLASPANSNSSSSSVEAPSST